MRRLLIPNHQNCTPIGLIKRDVPGHYVPLHIEPNDLEQTLKTLPKLGFVGLNVTVPHKEEVMRYVDVVTDRATLIGAANTLIFRPDGKIKADNTDGFGFIRNLTTGAPDWNPDAGPALVLGSGGACTGCNRCITRGRGAEKYYSPTVPARAPRT